MAEAPSVRGEELPGVLTPCGLVKAGFNSRSFSIVLGRMVLSHVEEPGPLAGAPGCTGFRARTSCR